MDREVQQREERDLGFEEVVIRVDREVEVGEEPVRRGDGTGVKVARSEELAANLVEVTVDLLENPLEARERRGKGGGLGDEARLAKRCEGRLVAVLFPPALSDLGHAATDPLRLRRAVDGDQAGDRAIDGGLRDHPRSDWRRPSGDTGGGNEKTGQRKQQTEDEDAHGPSVPPSIGACYP